MLGVVALAQQTIDSADLELKTSMAGSALRLSFDFAFLATAKHVDVLCVRADEQTMITRS